MQRSGLIIRMGALGLLLSSPFRIAQDGYVKAELPFQPCWKPEQYASRSVFATGSLPAEETLQYVCTHEHHRW